MTTINRVIGAVTAIVVFALTACGPANDDGQGSDESSEADVMAAGSGFSQTGMASYYGVGDGFHGRRTANGERFDAYGLTAAHRTLRFGTCLMVTNTANSKAVRVRINDRGPYSGNRILDLSYGAAKAIGLLSAGVGRVRIDAVSCSGNPTAASANNSGSSSVAAQPNVDGQSCKVYLTVNSKSADALNVTVQSRPLSGEERACGSKVRLVGSGSVAQAKELNTLTISAGNGRLTAQIPLTALEGMSHLFAEVTDSQGTNRGQSDAKALQLNAGI